ncbi:hypothetical protein HOA56_00375, partial [archaeon]|nr:hypothetical protein [archaeon]
GKPVYCSDCFRKNDKGSSSSRSDRSSGSDRSSRPATCNCKDEIEKLNQKIELILEIVKGFKKSIASHVEENEVVVEKEEKKEKKPKAKKTETKKKTSVKKKATKKK